eukprot:4050989-Karenia_brevis.AAC.1
MRKGIGADRRGGSIYQSFVNVLALSQQLSQVLQMLIIGGTIGMTWASRSFLDVGRGTPSGLGRNDSSILLEIRDGGSIHDLILLVDTVLRIVRQGRKNLIGGQATFMRFDDFTVQFNMMMTRRIHDLYEGHVVISFNGANVKRWLMLNDTHSGIKNTKVDAHAIWDMFFQGEKGLPTEISNSRPHYGINKHVVYAGPSRPRGDVMLVTCTVI